ncbi:MAG: redoxin domain-containing protein [Myxococcales bacterium FL481]|nr:MAG: redoxin domain-containing protein [Myxococcales bacterium FL481]
MAAPRPAGASSRSTEPWAIIGYLVFVTIGGVLVFLFAWSLGPAVRKQAGAACRELTPEARDIPAPDFEFAHRDGTAGRFSDYRGKFVVVNFWATWCEPCAREWPELDRLARRFADRDDVAVLAVSVDESMADAEGFLAKMAISDTPAVVVHDPSKAANRLFGSEKLPDTFFVDRSGQIIDAFINVRKWGSQGAFHCVEQRASE